MLHRCSRSGAVQLPAYRVNTQTFPRSGSSLYRTSTLSGFREGNTDPANKFCLSCRYRRGVLPGGPGITACGIDKDRGPVPEPPPTGRMTNPNRVWPEMEEMLTLRIAKLLRRVVAAKRHNRVSERDIPAGSLRWDTGLHDKTRRRGRRDIQDRGDGGR